MFKNKNIKHLTCVGMEGGNVFIGSTAAVVPQQVYF